MPKAACLSTEGHEEHLRSNITLPVLDHEYEYFNLCFRAGWCGRVQQLLGKQPWNHVHSQQIGHSFSDEMPDCNVQISATEYI